MKSQLNCCCNVHESLYILPFDDTTTYNRPISRHLFFQYNSFTSIFVFSSCARFILFGKIAFNSSAATKIVDSTAHLLPSHSSAKFYNVVKLGECVEEFDMTKREAKFAFRSTDLGSWDSDFFASVSDITNSKPKTIQHWALVVHFPRGKKTYFFKARADNGLLLAYRAEGVAYQVFEKAIYFGTTETCPSELLEKAKQVPTGEYDVLLNNRQTWLKDFLLLISPALLVALHDKVPDTKTYLNYLARKFNK